MELNNWDIFQINQFIKNTRKESITKKQLKIECEKLIEHFIEKQEKETK